MTMIRVAKQQSSISVGMSAPTDLYAGDLFDQSHGNDLIANHERCQTQPKKIWLHRELTAFAIMKRSSTRLGSALSNTEGTIGTEQAQITPGLDQPDSDYVRKMFFPPLMTLRSSGLLINRALYQEACRPRPPSFQSNGLLKQMEANTSQTKIDFSYNKIESGFVVPPDLSVSCVKLSVASARL